MIDVKKLDDSEKLKLVVGKNEWNNYDLDGKIYTFRLSDGPVGLRLNVDPCDGSKGDMPSVAYPSAQMLSHTWNIGLAKKMGEAIANDCAENGVDIILGPAVNIKRLPICGRNFEYFSEDPILAGYIAKAYIEGVQENHVGACVKHYCLNNIEYARLFSSSDASERTMREIYLRQFEIAMRAKPWTVMCSYNAVGGTYMAENKKMFDILRGDLGFDGLIMSDWTAVKVESRSINAGLDLAMPYEKRVVEKLDEDYKNGLVDGDALNRCAANVVALAEKCESESKLRKVTLSKSEREQISKDIESEGIVLLKNNGVLPLNEGAKVLVTGAPERKYYTGGGSAKVTPSKNYVRLGSALNALGFDSCYRESARENVGGQMCMNGSMISCREEMKTRDVAIIEVGNPESCETECRDRQTIKLSREEEDIIKYISKFTENVIVVVYAGSAVDMSEWIDDVSAVVWSGFGGQCVNEAVAEVLAGKINPSGKLTETFPLSLEDVKAMHSYYDPETFAYQEGLFVGYRYFETENVPVLFPFGYGLSYSEFEYSNLSVKLRSGGGITAEFDVTNISDTDGTEIAELYIEGLSSESGRPKRELKGFAKKPVGAHRTEHYEIDVCADDLRYFSEKTNSWQMPHGTLSFMIGKNCRDIVLEGKIKI